MKKFFAVLLWAIAVFSFILPGLDKGEPVMVIIGGLFFYWGVRLWRGASREKPAAAGSSSPVARGRSSGRQDVSRMAYMVCGSCGYRNHYKTVFKDGSQDDIAPMYGTCIAPA